MGESREAKSKEINIDSKSTESNEKSSEHRKTVNYEATTPIQKQIQTLYKTMDLRQSQIKELTEMLNMINTARSEKIRCSDKSFKNFTN